MGNEMNVLKAYELDSKGFGKFNSSKILSSDVDSSYKGVKTSDASSFTNNIFYRHEKKYMDYTDKQDLTTQSSSDIGSELCIDEVKVSTKFEWKEGGSLVYIVGSFSHWTQWFIMKNTSADYFELTLVIVVFFICKKLALLQYLYIKLVNFLLLSRIFMIA